MSLASDLMALRDHVLAELTAAHDNYADTRIAWRIVRKVVKTGGRFTTRNQVTGTQAAEAELISKAGGYIKKELAQATFQLFNSIFESFFFDLLRLWLTAFPQNLIGKKVDFKAILDATDKEAIIQFAIGKELNEVLYERPTAWFE